MKVSTSLLLVVFLTGLVNAQTTTFTSPGQQRCQSTNTELAAVVAPDGVTIKPYLWVDAPCLDTDLNTISINDCSQFPYNVGYQTQCAANSAYRRKPTFCYNNGYFPSTSGYPLAVARNSTANGGNCAFARSHVTADFSKAAARPKGLSFTVNDVDNPYDSIEVRVYSAGNLVAYNFTFGDANPATSFAWSSNTTGSGTVVQFNGGANGVWGESRGWDVVPIVQTANQDNAKGTIYFTVDPNAFVDSVVMTQIIRNTRSDINAATSIGNFRWTANQVLPVTFGAVNAVWDAGQLTVDWQTLSEKNNDHFEVQASTDGQHFKTIGIVQSKAVDGVSDQPVFYRFSITEGLSYATIALSITVLSLFFFLFNRKNKWVLGCCILFMSATLGVSCNKSSETVKPGEKELYIRILQVDTDGNRSYSQVVKTVNP